MVEEAFPEKVNFEQTSDDESVQQDQSIPGRGEASAKVLEQMNLLCWRMERSTVWLMQRERWEACAQTWSLGHRENPPGPGGNQTRESII